MLKNPSYSGISTEFWNACAAIAGPRALDAVGRAQLRQGPAGAGDGHRPRRQPARFRNIKIGSALCRLNSRAAMLDQVVRRAPAPRRRGSRSHHRQPFRAALTRFANNAIHQNVAEPSAVGLSRARADRRTHRARHHQPAGPRCVHPRSGGRGHRAHEARRARRRICCRWPSPADYRAVTAGPRPPRTSRPHERAAAVAEAIRIVEAERARPPPASIRTEAGVRPAEFARRCSHYPRDHGATSPSPPWPPTAPAGPRQRLRRTVAYGPAGPGALRRAQGHESREPARTAAGRYTR